MRKKWRFRLISEDKNGNRLQETIMSFTEETTYEEFCRSLSFLDLAKAEEQLAERFGFSKVEIF